jgi:hypothetical protein
VRKLCAIGLMLMTSGSLASCGAAGSAPGSASNEGSVTVSTDQISSTAAGNARVSSGEPPSTEVSSAPPTTQTFTTRMVAPRTALPQALPVLSPVYQPSADRDAPKGVLRAIARQQNADLAKLKATDAAPVSKRAGCSEVLMTAADRRHPDHPATPPIGQPYAPSVDAHLIGHHIEVAFSFSHWPKSLGCRPAFLTVVIFGKHPKVLVGGAYQRRGEQAITTVQLAGPRGRVVSELPLDEPAPYQIWVFSELYNNSRSLEAVSTLTCPNTTSTTRGCAPPDTIISTPARSGSGPAANIEIKPGGRPKPLHDLTHGQLLHSLRSITAHQPARPSIICSRTVSCTLTYRTSTAPGRPYRIRYSVAAEQVAGCWMATRITPSDSIPAYAYPGEDQLAGCVRWPS